MKTSLQEDLPMTDTRSPIANVYDKTLVNLIFTYNWINTALKKQFEPFKITVQQYNLLRILKGRCDKPATINLLKERMIDKMSDTSRIVERLVQKGLVDRKICKVDRRAVDISITESGLDILKKMENSFRSEDIIGHNLKNAELSLMNEMLEKLRT